MAKVDLTLNPLVLWNMEFADKVTDINLRDVDTLLNDIGWNRGYIWLRREWSTDLGV